MKRWYGGTLILALATILALRYGLMNIQPKKQSAYDFFRNHPTEDSHSKNSDSLEAEVVKTSERPHLIHIEGLRYLIAPDNITKRASEALLLWSHMHPLLMRSDALPETVQGVKEASIAWNDLLSAIKAEKTIKVGNTNNSKAEICPSSVTSPDKIAPTGGIVLEIPCGLVEDSSITLVGIPNGQQGGFQIELLGSQASEEPNRPIILHYNVSLPGDNMSEESFIVQNTWTDELKWGKEERCPTHLSASSHQVDGLVLCNERVLRSTGAENISMHHNNDDTLTNVSRGQSHESTNFPFIEGNLFTATLWIGLEGFHMNVNGRHETSFEYREKLEPWTVNQVKVTGGLDLLSSFAKGLPVFEDHDFINSSHLGAPPIPKKRLLMLVGVFSTGNNFKRRMALRRTWMQYKIVRSGDVAVRFFIGFDKNAQVNWELWREVEAYGDIQLMPFVDYYSLITLKTIAICIYGTKILPAKYIMKTDDDAFVRIDEVLSGLKSRPASGLLYGLISFDSSPDRDKDSKWHISMEEWPNATYPPWAHGPGYVISRDIAKFIVRGHQSRALKLFKLEDVAMGIWIEQFSKGGKEVQYINEERFYNSGCEANYILAHYQSPRLVLCLWERLQKQFESTCCD
ncbi:hydroxyproline O-galactosyltransferase GALT3 [Cucurbita pepo subsp. pepo]|uniref:hydroxyproline O-galactosyltransferase GALT3 n=1 Tax=Cucurbita pepo subsp. pepo TaxID=3664 RepID=UPI000C9D3E2C|nr:hydroxyproline O-galactosyltransferase GALT3 [Cucurbita pepo subsp. pepo]XP_023540321.1 hydroxyproline O-galactosyltransferase GALT3 [Cucurbita pepo subsp. pepo]